MPEATDIWQVDEVTRISGFINGFLCSYNLPDAPTAIVDVVAGLVPISPDSGAGVLSFEASVVTPRSV